MNAVPDVFSPADLGPVTLRNRIIKAATFEAATPDALVTDDLIEYHRKPAAGGVGMTTVAYCAVTPGGRTERRQLWMRPEALPGLRRLAEAVHAEGAAISAQIGHAGPVADARSNKATALAPVRFFNPTSMRFARKATRDDIGDVIAAHADAARLAIDAGFDAVEIHLGHGYFCSSFLSPLINRRDDEFGGSLENRAKVARGVVQAVRHAVGDQIAVTAKLTMADGIRGGIRVDEALTTAKWLEDDGGLDALELTAGSSLVNPMYLFHGDVPVQAFANRFSPPIRWGVRMMGPRFLRKYPYRDGYLLDLARKFRAELSMPLILLGGITSRETMDLAMAEGFEFVAMARALLAEPDLINRIAADGASVHSVCNHCNLCMPTAYRVSASDRTHCVLTGAPG
ncbi:MAG: NADH:flavin oxidoreductase [Mycobacterium sp.]